MFDYEVMTLADAEVARFGLLAKGEYEAVVEKVEKTVSTSSGNNMLKLTFAVFDDQGDKSFVTDYLVFTPKMMWKLIKFCESAGILDRYENKTLTEDAILNRRLIVKIGIDAGQEIPVDKLKDKPVGSRYPDRNRIEDYVSPIQTGFAAPKAAAPVNKGVPFEDSSMDDIPF